MATPSIAQLYFCKGTSTFSQLKGMSTSGQTMQPQLESISWLLIKLSMLSIGFFITLEKGMVKSIPQCIVSEFPIILCQW